MAHPFPPDHSPLPRSGDSGLDPTKDVGHRFDLLNQAIKGARVGTWYWFIDTNHIEWSELSRDYLALPAGRAPSPEHFYGVMHPDDRERIRAQMAAAVAQQVADYEAEFRIVGPDGAIRWLSAPGCVYADESGRPWAMAGILIDITERRWMEERLKESRDMLELALAGAELAIWDVTIATGTIVHDEKYCAWLGYGPDEIGPEVAAWLALVHPDDLGGVNDAIRRHIAGETRLYEAEYRIRHKAGHWEWVQDRGKITCDPAGTPVRVSGTHLNISQRKHLSTEGADLLKRFEALLAGLDRPSPLKPAPAPTPPPPRSPVRLSGRNREILQLVADGRTSGEIARELGIAEGTAATHRRNLMRKLGLKNKAELVRYAIRHGIASAG